MTETLMAVPADLTPYGGVVGDAAWRLERKAEAVRRSCAPAGEQLLVGHAVEGVIDLDAGKALGVVREHLVGAELLRIEAPAPLRIVVARCSDQNSLRRHSPAVYKTKQEKGRKENCLFSPSPLLPFSCTGAD